MKPSISESNTIKSNFLSYMLENNRPRMDGFKKWSFHPGMRFNSFEQWWGDKKKRPSAHEGVDLCWFEDSNGMIKKIDKNTKIPAAFSGNIVKIFNDFLGKSIYITHDIFDQSGRQLYTAYGHTQPFDSVEIGKKVKAGEIVGLVSGFSGKKTSILPHLHVTFAWIPVSMHIYDLHWNNLGHDERITLIDPLSVL